MDDVLKQLPVAMTSLREWAASQDWSEESLELQRRTIGSLSG
jgi:hypothetical protein